jgi:AraC family transcriptional regulator of adaptative response / DNA-3-methyladenine glycosylase II
VQHTEIVVPDLEVCFRAMATRDARFDGQFFAGVVTTGIYCRPICPVRPPKRENMRFYPSSAAAQEAGFRPCLRCRPEVSPGLPAWIGTSATVTRALRLIEDGALDAEQHGSVERLADTLGVGERHLRRLFLEHVGATPIAVALNRRILFAKKLLTETALPIADVAFASGFGSVRRFNDAISNVYSRPPRELRRKTAVETTEGPITLRLGYRTPYDWDALVRFLSFRAIPGVESVTSDGRYERNFRAGQTRGQVSVRNLPELNCVEARIDLDGLDGGFGDLRLIVERLRRLFDLRANAIEIARHLDSDPTLRYQPGTRVPGCWDAFELCVRAILGQQITVAGATTLAGRIVRQYGQPYRTGYLFPEPQVLADATFEGIGLTSKRIETLQGIARAFANDEIDLTRGLHSIEERLCTLPGIGPWTAHYVAMRAANEPDAFPSSDLALRKAAGHLTQKDLEVRAEAWRPWRAYAALHLWNSLTHV